MNIHFHFDASTTAEKLAELMAVIALHMPSNTPAKAQAASVASATDKGPNEKAFNDHPKGGTLRLTKLEIASLEHGETRESIAQTRLELLDNPPALHPQASVVVPYKGPVF